jgi:hypothetical protein
MQGANAIFYQNAEPEPDPEAVTRAALGGKKILCRVCQGDHFTTKCPYKETLGLSGGTALFISTFNAYA